MSLLAWALLGAASQDLAEVDRLIRSLGAEGVEERETAQDRLIQVGLPAVPALKAAAGEGVGEAAARARAALVEIARLEADLDVDRLERTRRIALRRGPEQLEKEKKPESRNLDGRRFDWFAVRREEHLALWTFTEDYLSDDSSANELRYEVVEAKDGAGKALEIERCGRCSPGGVLLRGTAGPVSVRIRGTHLWFSPRSIEFEAPKNGDRKKVSDFSFEVAWPVLRSSCRRAWPVAVWEKAGKEFSYEVKEGVFLLPSAGSIGSSGGGGGRFSNRHWCGCSKGPTPWVDPVVPPGIREAVVLGDPDTRHINVGEVKSIRYRFRKPVLETFDFTLEAAPRK